MREFGVWLIEHKSELLACLLEILLILSCINGTFKNKFRIQNYNIVVILLNILILVLINFKIVHKALVVFIYIIFFVYCVVSFKRKIMETIGRFFLGLLFAGTIEVIASMVAVPIANLLGKVESFMLLINFIGFLISILSFEIYNAIRKKKRPKLTKENWIILIIVCSLAIAFLAIDYRYRGKLDQIYYFMFLVSCIVACTSAVFSQQAKLELEKQKLELELQRVYGDTYKELISEVRRKQHDFSNQLSALYSMHLTAESMEDLIEKQSAYGKVLLDENRYDKILIGCNNPILAGYIYYRCVAYEKDGVLVDYQVHVDGAECVLSLHEIIEVLGILLTNAFEHCMSSGLEKKIRLIIEEYADKLAIEVGNQANALTSDEITELFNEGKSSKGKERGIGLARIKQLTDRVKADLFVENHRRENANWLNFKIWIPKHEGE